MAKYETLTIIVCSERFGNLVSIDKYGSERSWKSLGSDSVRETSEGMKVQYQYFHDLTFQNRPDAARAILKKRNGEVEKIAYIHGAYSEDFSLERKLNKMLGIKLKRKRSS